MGQQTELTVNFYFYTIVSAMEIFDSKLTYPLESKSVWVAGHNGMVGSATVRRLLREECEILTIGRSDLDLQNQIKVKNWIGDVRPQAISVAAATVGGILANSKYPAEFLYDNIMIASNIIHAAHFHSVENFFSLDRLVSIRLMLNSPSLRNPC